MSWLAIIFLVLALVVLPGGYFMLCMRMSESGVAHPPYFSFFLVFGTFGGWILAAGLSPSGLAASCIVFLMTIAPLSLIASMFWLLKKRTISRYHDAAFRWSAGYFGFLATIFLIGMILDVARR